MKKPRNVAKLKAAKIEHAAWERSKKDKKEYTSTIRKILANIRNFSHLKETLQSSDPAIVTNKDKEISAKALVGMDSEALKSNFK